MSHQRLRHYMIKRMSEVNKARLTISIWVTVRNKMRRREMRTKGKYDISRAREEEEHKELVSRCLFRKQAGV